MSNFGRFWSVISLSEQQMKLMPKQPQKYIGLPLTRQSMIRFDQGYEARWTLAPALAPMEVFRQLRLRFRQKLTGSDGFGFGSGEPGPEPEDFGPATAHYPWISKSSGSCFAQNMLAPMAPAPAPRGDWGYATAQQCHGCMPSGRSPCPCIMGPRLAYSATLPRDQSRVASVEGR